MSNQTIEQAAVAPQMEPEGRRIGIGTFLVGSALTIGVMTGPGAYLGYHIAAGDVARAESYLDHVGATQASETQTLADDRAKMTTFIGGLPGRCGDVVATYLPGNPNAALDTAQADVAAASTRVCPAGDATLVYTARSLQARIDQDTARIRGTNAEITSDQSLIANKKYEFDGVAIGVAVELVVLAGATMLFSKEHSVILAVDDAVTKYFDMVSARKTANFWKKVFKSRKSQAA